MPLRSDTTDSSRFDTALPSLDLPPVVRIFPSGDDRLCLGHAGHDADVPGIKEQTEVSAFSLRRCHMRGEKARFDEQFDHDLLLQLQLITIGPACTRMKLHSCRVSARISGLQETETTGD